jgi:hypothetical protein
MTVQLFESEKLKRAADISYALAAEITDLLKLREALQTASRFNGSRERVMANRSLAGYAQRFTK